MTEKNDIEITIKVNDDGAIQIIDKFGNNIEKAGDQAKQAETGFSSFQASIVTIESALSLATRGISLVSGAFDSLGDAVKRGAEIDDIANSFDNLSTKAGIASDTLLNNLNVATDNTISNLDLMKIANDGLIAGLDPNAFDEVAEAARAYADSVGGDAKTELQAFIDGLARGDDRFLKSRGILLDNQKAFDDYAKTIGTTADKLSELGKAEALKIAGTKALVEQTERLGAVEVDAADAIDQVYKAIQDTKDEFFRTIGSSEALQGAFTNLGLALKGIDFKSAAENIAKFGGALINITTRIIPPTIAAINDVARGFNYLFGEDAERAANDFKNKIADIKKEVVNLENAIPTYGTGAINRFLKDRDVARLKELNEQLRVEESNLRTAEKAIADADSKTKQLDKSFEDLINSFKDSQIPAAAATAGANKLAEATKSVSKEIKEMPTLGPGNDKGYSEFFEETAKAAEKAEQAAKEALEKLNVFGKNKGGFFGFDLGLEDGFESSISSALTNAIAKIAEGGLKTADYKNLFSSSAGSIADSLLPGTGPLAELLSNSVFDAFDHAFGGGNDPDNNARKKVDKFFADVFEKERLQLIIDGQLKDVFDLDFGGANGFNSGGFDDELSRLSVTAQQAFGGVGTALNGLLETGQTIGGQIAAVLNNNVGGSLNNLQILVGTLGFSFEQMSEAIVDSALKGEISFLEAQGSLIGIQKLAEKGIPDAIGDTTQAFKNLLEAGTKGGRYTVDALQDIAAEAIELGKHTLPELESQLTASGQFTEEQITGLFSSLAQSGIDSLDELLNASNETLIAILSDLQSKDILTEAQKQATDLIESINSIPDRKDVVINVKTNISESDRQVVSKIAGTGQSGQGL